MSEEAIEVHGADIEAAIEAGLQQLGLERSDVVVEVVEEGRKGILGLGGREAVVRLRPLTALDPAPAESVGEVDTAETEPGLAEKATLQAKAQPLPVETTEATAAVEEDEEEEAAAAAEKDEEAARVAREIAETLLEKMGLGEAIVSVTYSEPDDKTGRIMSIVEVEGDDLGSLIGAHGKVLNDFQYLVRLMAGHVLRRRADFVIDIGGYRERRKEALSSLARRMAGKVLERGEPITLEPMSAYDRRLIHMALRDNEQVYTNSVGEGASRRVRIFPSES